MFNGFAGGFGGGDFGLVKRFRRGAPRPCHRRTNYGSLRGSVSRSKSRAMNRSSTRRQTTRSSPSGCSLRSHFQSARSFFFPFPEELEQIDGAFAEGRLPLSNSIRPPLGEIGQLLRSSNPLSTTFAPCEVSVSLVPRRFHAGFDSMNRDSQSSSRPCSLIHRANAEPVARRLALARVVVLGAFGDLAEVVAVLAGSELSGRKRQKACP